MGHLLFIILHIVAVIFGFAFLLLTIPLHLIYAALKGRKPAIAGPRAPDPRYETKCPQCAEIVLKDARVCKHCGHRLAPAAAT